MEDGDRYRCCRIYLERSDDPACQARAACEVLINIEGILLASPFSKSGAHIICSLDKLSFEIVTELLGELDFEMDNSLLLKLRNSIFGFVEENVRGNMQIDVTELQQGDGEIPQFPRQDTNKYWGDYR